MCANVQFVWNDECSIIHLKPKIASDRCSHETLRGYFYQHRDPEMNRNQPRGMVS